MFLLKLEPRKEERETAEKGREREKPRKEERETAEKRREFLKEGLLLQNFFCEDSLRRSRGKENQLLHC